MKLQDAKTHFVSQWGNMAGNWGVNRTMGQIHACLLLAENEMSAESLMDALNVSRGNVNMSLRSLMEWGLVEKVHKIGERREFFKADKDPHRIMVNIAQQRRKREIEPLLKLFENLENIESTDNVEEMEVSGIKNTLQSLGSFTKKQDKLLKRFIKSEEDWYMNLLSKILK